MRLRFDLAVTGLTSNVEQDLRLHLYLLGLKAKDDTLDLSLDLDFGLHLR